MLIVKLIIHFYGKTIPPMVNVEGMIIAVVGLTMNYFNYNYLSSLECPCAKTTSYEIIVLGIGIMSFAMIINTFIELPVILAIPLAIFTAIYVFSVAYYMFTVAYENTTCTCVTDDKDGFLRFRLYGVILISSLVLMGISTYYITKYPISETTTLTRDTVTTTTT
jgi:hypothetical protein